MERWSRFFQSWQKDLVLWVFCMAFFACFRIAFLVVFRHRMEPTSTFATILSAFLNGMRYDAKVSTTFMLVPFCFSTACIFKNVRVLAGRVRAATGLVFVCLSSALCLITIEYFREYNDQFNHYLFGLIYDDRAAIFKTILSTYHASTHLVVFIVTVTLAGILLRRVLQTPLLEQGVSDRIASRPALRRTVTVLIVAAIVFGLRGSIGAMPARERHAGITTDDFLNKTVLNPYSSLRYAIQRHIKISREKGVREYLPDGDVAKALRRVYGPRAVPGDIDASLLRTAKGASARPPAHIFWIVAESYSAWPLEEKYASLHVADGLKELAHEGISCRPFVASTQGTMSSLNTIVTGLPDADIQTNYRMSSKRPYPTSITTIFERLGYRTRAFYGGYLTWQRVGDFLKDQGFDEVYGGGEMGSWLSANEWGVDDEHIFSFVLKTVKDEVPSFNLILTTSLHPPYTVDLPSKGFHRERLPSSIDGIPIDDDDARFLGHIWYADRCILLFCKEASSRYEESLFIVTADHPGRRWLAENPDPLERHLIPFVMYGRCLPRDTPHVIHTPGCHIDVVPTVVELTAPKGFAYHTMGKDLLDSAYPAYAVGRDLFLTREALVDLRKAPRVIPLEGVGPAVPLPFDVKDMQLLHDGIHGIAWWRVMKGPRTFEASPRPE
ncbi:MAG TPA: LTA synthase family protein [Deltaproteobacteria bacterium]|nr:LTA synthase family protein [Deltaproteobacteria bacterium]HPP81068.1 LTA synthase family protein [Deltaproteobacteria bacterium]